MDISGSIDTAEFMVKYQRSPMSPTVLLSSILSAHRSSRVFQDKLKQFARERLEQVQRCQQIFNKMDADGKGMLDEQELHALIPLMGLQDEVDTTSFVKAMLVEMDSTADAADDGGEEEKSGDGMISREEFEQWYLAKGIFFMDKPQFEKLKLEVPPMALRRKLFRDMDQDQSGELNHGEHLS